MRAAVAFRAIRRELRGGRRRFVIFTACLASGVAAVTGVASLTATIDAGVRAQSRRLLGADLVVSARRPLPDELGAFFAEIPGDERTDVVELATMAAGGAEGRSQLVELLAVAGRYPLHGNLRTRPAAVAPGTLADHEILAAPDLLRRLGVAIGDEIRLGGVPFRVAGELLDDPERLDFTMALGPRVIVTIEGLGRTGLLEQQGRIRYRALHAFAGDPPRATLDLVAARLRERFPASLEVETHHDAQPTLRRALRRVESFLGLAALLSLVLGGAGVAQVVRAWIAGRLRAFAVLRCLGARPAEVVVIAFGQVAVLAVAGSAIGAAIGTCVPLAVSLAAPDLVPRGILSWQPASLVRGLGLGVGIALAFAMPPVLAAWRVPPARVLRVEADPLPVPVAATVAATSAVGLATLGAAWGQSGNLLHALIFTAGLGTIALVLALTASGLGAWARHLPDLRLPTSVRAGLAALGRPGAGSRASIAGLAIGVGAVVAHLVIEARLDEELSSTLPAEAPTVFLVDVQPEQWRAVRSILVEEGADGIDSVPVVMARLATVDGTPVEDLVKKRPDDERAEWVLTREQRLTWRSRVPPSNELTAGVWWRDDDRREVSLEEGYAADLRAGIGTTVRFDVQGVPVDFVVSSLRSVAWESFAINFFWIAEPGSLEGAPRVRIASARLPAANEGRFQDRLAAAFPNVTVLRIRPLLERIRGVLDRLATGIDVLATFAALAGVMIVAAAVTATSDARRREVALLRTLGATRRGIVFRLAVELAVAGAAAGVTGSLAGLALAAAYLEWVLPLGPSIPPVAIPAATVAAAALAALAGLGASRTALDAAPLEVLRSR